MLDSHDGMEVDEWHALYPNIRTYTALSFATADRPVTRHLSISKLLESLSRFPKTCRAIPRQDADGPRGALLQSRPFTC